MPTYAVTLTAAEDKALRVVALDPQDWIDNVVHERCRIAMETIVKAELERILDTGQIPETMSRDSLVLDAPVQSARAVLEERMDAERAQSLETLREVPTASKGASE